jgi:NIPSNAP
MDSTKSQETTCCPVVELRQYTLKPGQRDTLIALFEREFIESQEALGMRIIGTFRDLEKPDRFVWLRGFRDMESRAVQLQEFYGGPIWKAHREAANATMTDSDNVLLLRPATPGSGFSIAHASRAARDAAENPAGLIVATLYHLESTTEADFADYFQTIVAPALTAIANPILGSFITEHHENTFPGLPVREDANVFIRFSRFPDRTAYGQKAARAADEIGTRLAGRIKGEPEVLFLTPTARSLLGA